jgi:hypothetical protein
VHEREAGEHREMATAHSREGAVDGFGEQSARVGVEWRRVDDADRAELVRELLDDVASLRPLERGRR